jgi:adenosylcobinamide-GDP ribazoletransferase
MPMVPPSWSEAALWRDEARSAFAFLTRLPLGGAPLTVPLAQASWAFPLVGLVVGLAGAVTYAIAAALSLPPLPAALLAVTVTILLTGGLHEDGLADTADGFGGGASAPDKLAIMRDSRSGAFGVLALVLSVSLRAAALAAIATGGGVLAALLAAHAVARGALPLVMTQMKPAREDGLGAEAGRPSPDRAAWAVGITIVVALAALGWSAGIIALVISGAAMALPALMARRQIGGHTGDVLGAIEQVGEIAVLLTAAAWLA